ncbi:hypothetical protein CEXT_263251 [Caerostris extrusa]|uniref:Uncharacterized protein n=1 Tax=Caerostris extrusa TaxID=172846 RepID=A0AAV4Y8P6_CAEEX|nr:hypothetical protein CEXT_263251 [Caerostris extrusa]
MVKSEDPHHESRKQHPDGLDLPSHKRSGGQICGYGYLNSNFTIFITRPLFHLTDTKAVFLEMVKRRIHSRSEVLSGNSSLMVWVLLLIRLYMIKLSLTA